MNINLQISMAASYDDCSPEYREYLDDNPDFKRKCEQLYDDFIRRQLFETTFNRWSNQNWRQTSLDSYITLPSLSSSSDDDLYGSDEQGWYLACSDSDSDEVITSYPLF